jgi:hypothetical protein
MLRSIRVYVGAAALALSGIFALGVPAAHAASPDICRPVQGCGCGAPAASAQAARLGPEICL